MTSKSTTIELPQSWQSPKEWKPAPYMKKAVKFLLEHAAGGLFLDPGLRKTSITLAAIKILKQEKVLKRALVIAPRRPCYLVWPKELEKWKDFSGLRYQILHGPKKDEALRQDADIYIMNPDGLPWLMRDNNFKRLNADTLIVDESTKFKHTNTKRFKLLKPVLKTFRRRWILTGTPAPKSLMDLFGQAYIVDLGNALGQYITHFRMNYFYPSGYGGYEWKLQPGAEDKIYDRLKPLVLRLDAEDYIELPKIISSNVWVDLPEDAEKIYRDMEEEMIIEMESGETVTAVSAASARTKCKQIANGALYLQQHGTKREWGNIHDAKLEALLDRIEENGGSPVLVAYEFDHDKEKIIKALGGKVPIMGGGTSDKEAAKIEAAWNRGEVPVLLGHPQSMGHGLNLQESGNRIIWYGLTENYEDYDQFNRRLRRSGAQYKQVFIDHIVTRGTVDEAKLMNLDRKHKTQKQFLDVLRTYIKQKKK